MKSTVGKFRLCYGYFRSTSLFSKVQYMAVTMEKLGVFRLKKSSTERGEIEFFDMLQLCCAISTAFELLVRLKWAHWKSILASRLLKNKKNSLEPLQKLECLENTLVFSI